MTRLGEEERKCYLCGATHVYLGVLSTNKCGAPDLDTRPAEMLRSTLPYWIQRCPACGYCAPDVATGTPGFREIVTDRAYQRCIKDASYTELANSFRGRAILQEAIGDIVDAGWAYLHAAWACDDTERFDAAWLCRLQAVRAFKHARAQGLTFAEERGSEVIMLADLWRRSGHFEQAIEAGQTGLREIHDVATRQVLQYEISLAWQRETRCARSSEIFDQETGR
jgi:hypothetical protein